MGSRSPTGTYRELTLSAVVLGILQGIVLNVAFVYASALRFIGFSAGRFKGSQP